MNGAPTREELLERLKALEDEVARFRRADVVPGEASEVGGVSSSRGPGGREPERRRSDPEGLLRVRTTALQEAHDRFRLLVETVPYAIEELSADGTILFANPAHHRIYGYGTGEVVGRSVALFAPSEDDGRQLLAYLRELAREQPPPTPWFGRGRTKDGRSIDLRVDWNYRRDRLGAVSGFVSVVTDVTEQKRESARLRENLALLETIIESSADAIYMKDLDGVYRLTNGAGSALVGRTPAEVLGRADEDFFPPEVVAYIRANDLRVMESGQVLTSEDKIETPGAARVMLSVKSPYRDGSGRVVGVVGVSRDITERKRGQEELQRARDELERRVLERTAQLEDAKAALERDIEARRRAERAKEELERTLRHSQALEAVGRLAGGVAHDFNNLLGAVLACSWAARLEDASPEQVRRELERIQDLCKQGGEVTRQLLAVARQSPARVAPLDLRHELGQILVLVERACPRTVSVTFDVGEEIPRVVGDRALLTTALLNLCLNARDAMPGGGTLTLRAERERGEGGDEWVLIRVSDTGEGIPKDLQDRVFQPFFSTKRKGRGVGLGLSMAFATARDMGGSLMVDSEPGRGATFTFRLPAYTQADDDAFAFSRTEEEGEGRRPVDGAVLVVEDEEDIARMVTDVLTRGGVRVLRARTGLEALEVVRDRADELRLVLLDLMLPELPGTSIHQVLRATVPDLPVVFMSGRDDVAAQAAPAVPLLRKPFTESELEECVRRNARS